MNILQEAEQATRGDREQEYGHPADDFKRIVNLTAEIRSSDLPEELKHALYMIQVKISRLIHTPDHHDSIVDIAGYADVYSRILSKINSDSNG